MYEKKIVTVGINGGSEEDEGEEYKEEGVETSIPQSNALLGLCAVCHLTLSDRSLNLGLDDGASCSKGHALCHRCMQHFSIRADPGCVLCRTNQFQQSSTSFSRESNSTLNSTYAHSNRIPDFAQSRNADYHHNPHQRPPHVKPWVQNRTAISSVEENEFKDYDINESEQEFPYQRSNMIPGSKNQSNHQEIHEIKEGRQQRQRSDYSLMKKECPNIYISEVKVNGQITTDCSRRPIRCPRIDCAINVAFSALTHHFIFDHPDVPILSVDPGTKSTLIVSFEALSSNSSRCLALLLVSGKLSDPVARLFNGSQINPKYRNRLPLPVLAARLHCSSRCVSSNKICNDQEDYCEQDVIIAWVAGLDVGNTRERLRCSIQAVDSIDSDGLRSLTYTGPVNSLRTAQRPRDVFSTGDCIVLHEGLLSHITSDCANLNVNVTVH